MEHATFTLTEDRVADRRVITVESTAAAIAELTTRVEMWPQAASVCDDVLRAIDPDAPALAGVVTESLGYSTLQAGGEFAAWLRQRGPATAPVLPDPVVADRDGDTLHIRFNRPARHNAFSNDARAALLEALDVARYDPSVDEVILSGNGPSFCSGVTSPSSARSPTRRARTSRASGTAPRWCSMNSPPGSGRAAGAGARPGARQRAGDGRLLRMGRGAS